MIETPFGNIVLDEDEPRHYLDNKPIHCGDQLQIRLGGDHWVFVRYEMSLGYPNGLEPGERSKKVPKPTFHAVGGRIIPDNDAELRWPVEGK
jgi:hypothetical protein